MAKKLYVGNIPYTMSEKDLADLFGQHGAVVDAKIVVDRFSGRSKGFGFVEMEDSDVDLAIEALNGQQIGGRTIKVDEARPQPEGGGGGFHGGSGEPGERGERPGHSRRPR